MRLRIELDKDKISEIKDFSGEYIEILYSKGHAVLSSITGSICVFGLMDVLDGDNEDFCIRVESKIFDKLSSEKFMDIAILDSNIKILYYNSHDQFLYSIILERQQGFMEIKDKLELLKHLNDYDTVDLSNVSKFVTLLSKMELPLNVCNNVAYSYRSNSYFFKKFESPSFCCDSKILNKLISINKKITLIENYVYSELSNNGNSLFLNKLRMNETYDLDYILKSKFTEVFEVDMSNLFSVLRRLPVKSELGAFLNLNNSTLSVETEDRTIECNCSSTLVESAEVVKEEDVDVSKLLENLKVGKSSSVDLNSKLINKYPILNIPSWVLQSAISKKYTKIYLNKNFLVIAVSGGKLVISRSDNIEQKG